MKVKKCQGEGCTYSGQLWQAKGQLCKSCAMKEKATKEPKYVKVASSGKITPTSSPNRKDDKSIPELLKLATIAFNRWIKRRDAGTIGTNCISCSTWYPVHELQAGHYKSVNFSSLRFNEDRKSTRLNFSHGYI